MPLLSTCAQVSVLLCASTMESCRDTEALAASVIAWLLLRLILWPEPAWVLDNSPDGSTSGPPREDWSIILSASITLDLSSLGDSTFSSIAPVPTMAARVAIPLNT